MTVGYLLLKQWPLAVGWSVLALGSVLFTRYDGGIAFVWPATAFLIVKLMRAPRRQWWASLGLVGVTSFLITGLFGLGWMAAPVFVIINLGEAVIAAALMTYRAGRRELMANLTWFGRYLMAMVVASLAVSPLAGVTLWLLGKDPLPAIAHFISGHLLGNLAVVPFAYLLTSRTARRKSVRLLSRRRIDTCVLLPLLIGVNMAVFVQEQWPLLFLPVMFVVLATFRLGRVGAAIALVLLTLIGGGLTSLGHGPVALSGAGTPDRILFFQLFMASTVLTVLPIAADLHSRRQLLRKVRRSEAEFRLLAEHCTDVIIRISPDGLIRYVSPSIERLVGYRAEELVGTSCRELVHADDLQHVLAQQRATLALGGESHSYEYRARTRDRQTRWFSTHARALLDEEGSPLELLALVRDISAAKTSEQQWEQAAMTDILTGLPNRRALEARTCGPQTGKHCIALLDIDRFKTVNDTYGHDAGDAVLRSFAQLAQKLVRSNDTAFRLGGEEFVVLFEHTTLEQAYQVCDRLRLLTAQLPLRTPMGSLRVTISGGVALLDSGGLDAALKLADQALYRAKKGGRDQLQVAA